MKLIAGIDIGNSTTEVALAQVDEKNGIVFISSSITETTGTKGTIENVKGVITGLNKALDKVGKSLNDIDHIRINEAAPVIGDTAMETITETIITESTMIGHNPDTPGGEGLGIGITISLEEMENEKIKNEPYIVIVNDEIDYEKAAKLINKYIDNISGAIVQRDEAVLIQNRIDKLIPIVDEVKYIEKIPSGMKAAIEVAPVGKTIGTISNPYGIANIFSLTPEETRNIIPVAKSLVGNRSAVVIRTPKGDVKEKVIPAGSIIIYDSSGNRSVVDIDKGAEEIMNVVNSIKTVENIEGEIGSNVGGMLNNMKNELSQTTGQSIGNIQIKDILAIDTFLPVTVKGALAGEVAMEKAVGIAAMVQAEKLPMEKIAIELEKKLKIKTVVAGVEAVMATLGAWTTPGCRLPLAILDLGGGSTDAALLDESGKVASIHLAGAGGFITMMIDSELGLNNISLAEDIKRYNLAKVESLFQMRLENGEILFFDEPLEPRLFGRVVVCREDEYIPIESDYSMERIVEIRRRVKKRVFVNNAIRALKKIAPLEEMRNIPNVVMVGGSALDFEIPEMVMEELSNYNIVAGKGEIRRVEGPRNAVATGLIMSGVGSL